MSHLDKVFIQRLLCLLVPILEGLCFLFLLLFLHPSSDDHIAILNTWAPKYNQKGVMKKYLYHTTTQGFTLWRSMFTEGPPNEIRKSNSSPVHHHELERLWILYEHSNTSLKIKLNTSLTLVNRFLYFLFYGSEFYATKMMHLILLDALFVFFDLA